MGLKRLLVAAAITAGLSAQPASAEVVVVSGNNYGAALGALPGFDYSLGTLDGVTLAISGTENRSGFVIGGWPQDDPATADIGWSIDGTSNFSLFLFPVSQGSVELATFAVPISGSGEATVRDDDRSFEMSANGAATFSVDPSIIPQLGTSGIYDWDLALRFFGPGFYDGSDITFSSDPPLQPISLGPVCYGGAFQGEELCNFFNYTLSYSYTPNASAVPEPSTWMMMLVGFVAAGVRVRRNKVHSRLPSPFGT
ncbi:PEPxxWA-CTERM sorting domain-containing protein [Sphingomonas sp. SM33]|uniref:PEPxxWA-CTERM sorting domain-containing protein n=1 Tax=Sphingomonas telluris TaxID=2907998 RepID=A0ABS9VLM9_9SPHN|nr:PEPxxWA-CTERM sorting domain-containing protein [Sphingomonas telluris]MCH8615871.1 PEPxxWA-CTERM sorting domain-containing protein [Sphingomonas telluris]